MRIGFYIHHSTIKAGGIFTYSIGILKLLLNSNEIEKIWLIYSPEIRQQVSNFFNNPKIEPFEIDRRQWNVKIPLMFSYFFYDVYLLIKNYLPESKKFEFLKSLSFAINPYKTRLNRKNISLVHIPMQYSPVYSLNVPIITTMHDLQDFHFPEYFSSQERIHRAINNKKSLDESTHIIVSFNHIKSDVIKYFELSDDKITVCPPPFADNWFIEDLYADVDTLRKKYSLPEEFMLYPAATWQHKNHLKLFEALHILKAEGKHTYLICTGNKTEFYENVLIKEIDRLGINENVNFLGIIPEKDLIGLYKLTKLVVVPTLYEAGSAPLYEAMRYGAPVICSNVTSLPETIGDNEFMFNPEDSEEMAEKIKTSLDNEDFRKRNLENSKRRLQILKKIDYCKNFIDTYKKLSH
jgi:glycosyltransferase involved in cell wall biosynthesis